MIAVNSHTTSSTQSHVRLHAGSQAQRKSSTASTLFADNLVLRSVRVWPTDEKSL